MTEEQKGAARVEAAAERPACRCKCSTGIHEGLTFGQGNLSEHGFWSRPCWACARWHEIQDGEPVNTYWPFEEEAEAAGSGNDYMLMIDHIPPISEECYQHGKKLKEARLTAEKTLCDVAGPLDGDLTRASRIERGIIHNLHITPEDWVK